MSGAFVVFEGGDGVGKSTQVALLARRLADAGVPHLITRQPGGTATGDRIRQIVLDADAKELAPRAEALLYAADKAQHVAEVIAPALAAGRVVVSDRYVDSMLAYQGAGRELAGLTGLTDWATAGLVPDLTVLLDLDPARADMAGEDRIEAAGEGFHRRVREGFRALAAAAPQRYLVLPGREVPEEIAGRVWRRVEELIGA